VHGDDDGLASSAIRARHPPWLESLPTYSGDSEER
jgi:hypothetical protein